MVRLFVGPKRPSSPLLATLEWIRNLCSGCFGIVSRPRPPPFLSAPSIPSPMLTSTSQDLTMVTGISTPHNTSAATAAEDHKAHPVIESLAWHEPHVGLGCDSDEDAACDDAASASPESDEDAACDDAASASPESDGMFHGLLYLGSKLLTEVEMQSPVEERKVIATPIRKSRRSNNSSRASSTRELDFDSASPGCPVDLESCVSSSDAMARVSPCSYPITSPSCASSSCCKIEDSARMYRSCPHDQITSVLSFEGSSATPYKLKGQYSQSGDDSAALPSRRESRRKLDEVVEPSSESHLLQRGTLWKRQAEMGSSSSEGNPSPEQVKNPCAFRYRECGKYSAVPGGLQAKMPVSSLPVKKSTNVGSRGWRKDNYDERGRQQARNLTDEDFNELRGFIDLGFVSTEDLIPDLCETLPALEVCYSIAHGPVSPACTLENSASVSPGSPPPICPWKVASPGDQPQQVKTRLRHWAQAVACSLRHVR